MRDRLNTSEQLLCALLVEDPDRTNKELAELAGLNEKTTKNYVSLLFTRFGVHSRAGLAVKLTQLIPDQRRFCPTCGQPVEKEA